MKAIKKSIRFSMYRLAIKVLTEDYSHLPVVKRESYYSSHSYNTPDGHGFCYLMAFVAYAMNLKNSKFDFIFNSKYYCIKRYPELMKYCPKELKDIPSSAYWFIEMNIEGTEKRLNILKEIVNESE